MIRQLADCAACAVAAIVCFVLVLEARAVAGLRYLGCRGRFPMQVALVAVMLLQNMDYSFIIPIGYDLALEMEAGGAASSGWLISFNNAGTLIGNLLGWACCRRLSHRTKRGAVVASFLACAAAYVLLVRLLLRCGGREGISCGLTFEAMLGARVYIGFMQGVTLMYNIMVRELTPEEEQVSLSLWENFSLSGGMCLGPLVFSLAVLVGGSGATTPVDEALSASQKMVAASSAFAVLFAALGAAISLVTPPNVLELEGGGCLVSAGEAPRQTSSVHLRKHWLWTRGLVPLLLGAMGYTAVESASPLLLETLFGWEPDRIGLAISCSFAAATTVGIALAQARGRLLTDLQLIATLTLMGTCGALMFAELGPMSAARLLLGDCLLYPCLLVVNSVVEGYLYILAWPGTWYSTDVTVLAAMVLDQGGSFLSAPAARAVLERAGQTWYAALQISLVLLVASLALTLVPAMGRASSGGLVVGPHRLGQGVELAASFNRDS